MIAIILLSLIHNIAYKESGWTEFNEFNKQRTLCSDYGMLPYYPVFEQEYNKLSISKEEYVASTVNWTILDSKLNTQSLSVLTDFIKTVKAKPSVSSVINESYLALRGIVLNDPFLDSTIAHTFLFAICFSFFGIFLMFLLEKNISGLQNMAAIGLASMFCWFYLIIGGRFPGHVQISLFLIGLFAIIAVWANSVKKDNVKSFGTLIYLCVLIACLCIGIPDSVKANGIFKSQLNDISTTARQTLHQYAADNTDKLFIYCQQTLGAAYENAFLPTKKSSNLIANGSWTSRSPLEYEILNSFGYSSYDEAIMSPNDVYIVYISDGEIPSYITALLDYIRLQSTNAEIEITDRIVINPLETTALYITHLNYP